MHDFSVRLRTGSNIADNNRFRSNTKNDFILDAMSEERLIILNDDESDTIPDKVDSEQVTKQMRVSITTLKGKDTIY